MVTQVQPRYSVQWSERISDIPQSAWDELALPLKTPFLEWHWLNNLETSGSAIARKGWLPQHLTLWRDQTLVAAAPLYIKGHSYGEFVFDHQWADVAYRMGIEYYPKLLGMTPFTPAEGYRFLIAPDEDEDRLTGLMVQVIDGFCDQHQLSGCHFLFVDPDWQPMIEHHGFKGWLHHSYIWQNEGFSSFDDYLAAFNANQRRNIKRERQSVIKAGLQLQTFKGEEIPEALYSRMHDYYSDTCDKFMWGSKYLTKRFFQDLQATYAHRVIFVTAYDTNPQQPVGMSFCLTKGDQLYGRYWGSDQAFDCLHFEACYYAPIEWAVSQGIQRFDPGAGGRHKKRRGFRAVPNYSLHRFYVPRLQQVFHHYVDQINQEEQHEIDGINRDLPFKKDP
jgi:predicted N-acyltransferase